MTVALPYNSTVSVEAQSKNMTSIERVKRELGVTVDTHNTFIYEAITQASAEIVSYCRREFAKETVVESFRVGEPVGILQLSRRPIVSVSSIVESGVTLTTDDYEIDALTGWIYRLDGNDERRGWECGKIVVTAVVGWEMLTDLPSDLERICIDLVKSKWFARKRDPLVKREEVPGVLLTEYWVDTGEYVRGLPAGIAKKLDELCYVDPVA
jgi:hypothetical protein